MKSPACLWWIHLTFSQKLISRGGWKDYLMTSGHWSMPAWLAKEYQDILIRPVTKIVNKSLSLAVFPKSMKADFVKKWSQHWNSFNSGKNCIRMSIDKPVLLLALSTSATGWKTFAVYQVKYLNRFSPIWIKTSWESVHGIVPNILS